MSKRQMSFNDVLKMIFGVFMVCVYLGMAVLMAIDFFDWKNTPLRWLFAVILGAYGLYRGYRMIKGEHTYGMRIQDDDTEENTYDSYSRRINQLNDDNNNDEK